MSEKVTYAPIRVSPPSAELAKDSRPQNVPGLPKVWVASRIRSGNLEAVREILPRGLAINIHPNEVGQIPLTLPGTIPDNAFSRLAGTG